MQRNAEVWALRQTELCAIGETQNLKNNLLVMLFFDCQDLEDMNPKLGELLGGKSQVVETWDVVGDGLMRNKPATLTKVTSLCVCDSWGFSIFSIFHETP